MKSDNEKIASRKKRTALLYQFIHRYILNKYVFVSIGFLSWIIFADATSLLVIRDLDKEIRKYERQVEYYKSEYEKNNAFFQRLMNNKEEREKYARENYFMKKPNEEIFILVVDSTEIKKKSGK